MGTERRPGRVRGGAGAGVFRPAGLRGLVAGDRPYLVALIGLITLATLMISGPLHRYLEGRDRLELLDRKRGALELEVERLERRAGDLKDPVYIEQLAREQLGLIKPGEIPYLVVTPDSEPGEIRATRPDSPLPWYRRVWRTLASIVH
ncbi:MAG: septum formation initiator family protein [Nitriliruptorales bacterium]